MPTTHSPGRPAPPHRQPARARSAVLAQLAERGGLWPLLAWNACPLCALPRRTPAPQLCDGCRQLRRSYGDALADVQSAALTAADWALGAALRAFKDAVPVGPEGPYARPLAAVLSAFLE